MFSYYNPHPQGKRVKDCLKRALTLATGKDGVLHDTWDSRDRCVYNAWVVK